MKRARLVDTDIQIQRRIGDPAVRQAAEDFCGERTPLAGCEFSLVEFKGSYIQDLLLLRYKIYDSDSIEEALHRIINSSDRKRGRMLAHIAKMIELDLSAPWSGVKGILLATIDAQIVIAWDDFASGLSEITRDFKCTRAEEAPGARGKGWNATIPLCRPENTRCTITNFMSSRLPVLEEVSTVIDGLQPEERTKELARIQEVAQKTISTKTYPWQGRTCRSVGDLLISLQSASHEALLTSNAKEHVPLSQAVGNEVEVFPVAEHKIK